MDRLISEQAVIDRITRWYSDMLETGKEQEDLIEVIKAIPSAEPKTGHWEWVQYDSNPNIGNWHCSECRTIIPHMPEETDNTPIYKWCPMCGAKMVEPQEISDRNLKMWHDIYKAESDHKCHNCKHYTSGERDGSCGSYICKHYSNWERKNEE